MELFSWNSNYFTVEPTLYLPHNTWEVVGNEGQVKPSQLLSRCHYKVLIQKIAECLQQQAKREKRLTPLHIWKYAVNILNHVEWHQTTST